MMAARGALLLALLASLVESSLAAGAGVEQGAAFAAALPSSASS